MLQGTEPVAQEFWGISARSWPVPVATEIESPSTAIELGTPARAGVGAGAASIARRGAGAAAVGAGAATRHTAPARAAVIAAAIARFVPTMICDPQVPARDEVNRGHTDDP